MPFRYGEIKKYPLFNKKIFFLYLLKGTVHCLINFFITVYSTEAYPIDKEGNIDCLWFTSVDLYSNIIVIVSLDLLIDTANITWINIAIQGGTTFLVYILFLIMVHNMAFFNSFASIYNSVISPLFWLNMFYVAYFCFLFDLVIKAFKYVFTPTLCKELQIIKNKYGAINSTEYLSVDAKEKLIAYETINEDKKEKKEKSKKKKKKEDTKIMQIENVSDMNSPKGNNEVIKFSMS